ncbi:heterogeneous nuclear ribonucleoproteins A2/B1-like [Battus philenor]|uniref:heterogeneous nuclear ribonucleoproteins A2/B1-like n=1 Tax=Battus philenor TaxID=42288 RepID=UPI0035D09F02
MKSLVFTIIIAGLCQALAEEAGNDSSDRVKRTLHIKNKLCYKFGLCGSHSGGNHGSYGSYQQYQGGYPYPPINIGISQSQSSSNAGGGGFGTGYYPNNYQYNGGYPNHGGFSGNEGYGGYGFYGDNKQRPGYFNGYESNNNQFNGNYYNSGGFPKKGYENYRGLNSNSYDGHVDNKPVYEDVNENGPNDNDYDYGSIYDGRSSH